MTETSSILVLSSADLPLEGNVRSNFQLQDPPPTEMKLKVDTRFLDLSVDTFNNFIGVYLSRYLLDCVWRDADDPSQRMTSNSGTSLSRRLKVFLYAGDPDRTPIRLLEEPVHREAGVDRPDFFLYRDQNYIQEKAHNLFDTNVSLSRELYLENQFTQQAEVFVEPGMYLGVLSAQAIMALRNTSQITLRWKVDRTDHPSPFWYNKFLVGSSVWNPTTERFEVVDADTFGGYAVYHQQLKSVEVTETGGPYFPMSLYTLAAPLNRSVAPFLNDSNLLNVSDPLDGEVNLLNHPSTTLHLSQVAVAGATDLALVQTSAVPPFAPSDLDGYRVPLVDVGASSQTNAAFTIHDVTSNANVYPVRYATQNVCSLHYPNGAWRGQPLAAGNTNVAGYVSPFPWERRLTPHQLAVLNETQAYNAAFRYDVLDAGQYLFMDPGTAWNEQARPQGNASVNDVTVGERSLQFDFGVGRPCFVNKCQLSFPRSQERHQPYRMQASLHKAYNGSADDTALSRTQTLWFGGVQLEGLSGSRTNSQGYKYLNTHSQSGRGLRGTYSTLWNTGARRLADAASFAPFPQTFETSSALTRGRAGVVEVPVPPAAGAGWYRGRPNDVNPALDFLRQEFGPFTQGATLADLKDPVQGKAWALDGVTADAQPIISPAASGRTFFDLVEYLASPTGAYALGYKVYVQDTAPTWTTSRQGDDWRFLVSNQTGNRLAAAGNAYVWTYQTGGTWTRQDGAGVRSWTGVATSSDGNVILACANTSSQLYRTENVGASWAPVGTTTTTWRGVALAGDGRTGFAIAEAGDIYRYQSQGGRVNIAATYSDEYFVDVAYATASSTVVAISDRDDGRGVLISTNDGSSWARVSVPGTILAETDSTWVSVAVASEGNVVVLAPGSGFLAQATLNTGTGTWTYASIGPTNGWNYSWVSVVIVGPPGTSRQFLATTDNGLLLRYSWTGSAWTWINAGRIQSLQERVFLKASRVVSGTPNTTHLVAAYEYGRVHMSYNSGVSWVSQTSATLPASASWRSVAISANGLRVAAVEEGGYIYVGSVNVASATTTWSRATAAGERDWTCVGISEDGQILYAGSDFGFLWGSTDGGQTWQRDVSPVAAGQNWMAVTVRQNRGFAVADFSTQIFRINLDSPPDPTPSVLAVGGLNTNWKAIDCSRDAEVVVAVPSNGFIHLSTDNGGLWTPLASLGTRPWTSVAVSGDGRSALAVASDGTVAKGSTVNTATRLDTWTVAAAIPPEAWTSVDVSDNFSVILATAQNSGIFVSSDGLNWAADERLAVADRAKPWSCVAVSGDGAVVAAGVRAPVGELRVLDAAQAWTALTLSSKSRVLAEGRGPKIVVEDPAFPVSSFLQSSAATYPAANLASIFSTSVYEFFNERHTVYLVDARRQANPGPSLLRDDTIVKEYRRTSGNVVFTTANPVSFIFSDVLGMTRVLLAKNNSTNLYYLVYPWNATDLGKRDLVMNPDYTKYVLSTVVATSPGTVVVSSANNNSNVYVRWNDVDVVGALAEGSYTSMVQFAQAFEAAMDDLKLYLVETATGNRKYFLWFEPVVGTTIRFHVENPPRGSTPPTGYDFPVDPGTAWPYSASSAWPALRVGEVENDNLGTLIGFDIGTYPPASYTGAVGAVYQKTPDFIPPWITVTIPPGTPSFQHAYEIYPGMYRLQGSLEPVSDYVVKETYYFAPQYDQYDTKQSITIDGVASFQPSSSDVAQKMVNPSLAVGQSFGVAFGSFLYDRDNATAPNEVYTRGPGNLMKLYSFRPMTQLFSFQTESGFLRDQTGTATSPATFVNIVEKGMLVNVAVGSVGAKYAGKDTTTLYVHPTLDWDEEGVYYDESTGRFADTSMYLMDQAGVGAGGGATTSARHARIEFEMEDDTGSVPVTTYTASEKTPLNRSAEFHLRFARGRSNANANANANANNR